MSKDLNYIGTYYDGGSRNGTVSGLKYVPKTDDFKNYKKEDEVWTGRNGSLQAQTEHNKIVALRNAYKNNPSGGDGDDNNKGTNYQTELFNLFNEQSNAARQQMLNAITRQLEATKNAYNSAMQNTSNEYDNLIDQNEVRKARAKRILKERQANLGNSETGLGRQENLDLNLGYDAQTSNLLKTKQQAVDEIANLIIQAEAEAEQNKANVNNTYANALLQYKLANL